MKTKSNSYQELFFYTLINYAGIAIGIFANLFLYPKNKEVVGLYRFVEGIAYVLYPIFVFGTSQSLINFNPKLNSLLRQQLFVYCLYIILSICGIFFLGVYLFSLTPFFKPTETLYISFGIAFCMAIIELLKKKAALAKKLIFPTLCDTLLPRLALPIVFILALTNTVSVEESLSLYVLTFVLILFSIALYLGKYFKEIIQTNFKKLFTKISKPDFYSFSLYAFAGSLGTIFAFRLDSIMIPMFLSMEENGNFSIAISLVSAIAIPATGLFALYSPIISEYFNANNLTELNIKYKEISIFLFFIGVLLYGCLFLGIEDLFLLLPTGKSLMQSVPIILILGITILINMGTGFNSEIITYSNKFKFNLIAILILVLLNVFLNVLFLYYLKLGIESVAVASLISMTVFNLVKLIYIYIKFNLFPFNYKYLLLVISSTAIVAFVNFIPDTISLLFNLVAKISIYLLLNLVLTYRLNLVKQYNISLDNFFAKLTKSRN